MCVALPRTYHCVSPLNRLNKRNVRPHWRTFFFLFFLPETVLEDVLSSRRVVSATATVSDKLPHLCPPNLCFCRFAILHCRFTKSCHQAPHTECRKHYFSLSRDGIEKLPLLFLSMAYHGSGEPWSPESGKEHRLERFLQEPCPRIVQRPWTPECGPSKVVSKDGCRKPSKGQAGERGRRLAPPSEAEPP